MNFAGKIRIAEGGMDVLQVRNIGLGPFHHGVQGAELAGGILVLVDQVPLRPAALRDHQRLEAEAHLPDQLGAGIGFERLAK